MREAWIYVFMASLLLGASQAAAHLHPTVLTQVKEGMWVGALAYRTASPGGPLPRRAIVPAYAGQRMGTLGIGQYTVWLNVSGTPVHAVIDTGSGAALVACKGVKVAPNAGLAMYDPTKAVPALKLVGPVSSAACQVFCAASNGCLKSPALAGACEFNYAYGDGSSVVARVYTGTLTFPGSQLPVDNAFSFGCAYKGSTNPYLFSTFSALIGMTWEPESMWSQLIAAKLISDTMYICLGNGEDGKYDQSGVLVLGSDNMVALPAGYVSEVVTITLLNPATNPALPYAAMWLRLTNLTVGPTPDNSYSGSKSLISSGNTPLYYLIDSGSSQVLLTPNEYNAWETAFYGALHKDIVVTETDNSSGHYGIVTLNKYYTPAQLDALLPPILFWFQGSSGPVRFMPSNYMVFWSDNTYLIFVAPNSAQGQGILGNAWMNGWLIQQTRSKLALKMRRVQSCKDVIY